MAGTSVTVNLPLEEKQRLETIVRVYCDSAMRNKRPPSTTQRALAQKLLCDGVNQIWESADFAQLHGEYAARMTPPGAPAPAAPSATPAPDAPSAAAAGIDGLV